MAAFFNRHVAPALGRVVPLDRRPAPAGLACFWHADGAGALHRHWRPTPETRNGRAREPAALNETSMSRG